MELNLNCPGSARKCKAGLGLSPLSPPCPSPPCRETASPARGPSCSLLPGSEASTEGPWCRPSCPHALLTSPDLGPSAPDDNHAEADRRLTQRPALAASLPGLQDADAKQWTGLRPAQLWRKQSDQERAPTDLSLSTKKRGP